METNNPVLSFEEVQSTVSKMVEYSTVKFYNKDENGNSKKVFEIKLPSDDGTKMIMGPMPPLLSGDESVTLTPGETSYSYLIHFVPEFLLSEYNKLYAAYVELEKRTNGQANLQGE